MSNQLDYEINKELGECYLFMGELDRAEEYYKKAVGSNGVHADPYLGLATIAVQRGELEQALSLYHKAASIEESDKAFAGIALVEMENGAHTEAFDHMKRALDINPENIISLFGLVQTAHVLERLEEALPYMENYLAIDPMQHDIRYSLAGCLVSMDKKDEAREHLLRILAEQEDHSSAQELLNQIG